jgi:hypothetical protein
MYDVVFRRPLPVIALSQTPTLEVTQVSQVPALGHRKESVFNLRSHLLITVMTLYSFRSDRLHLYYTMLSSTSLQNRYCVLNTPSLTLPTMCCLLILKFDITPYMD